MRMKLCMGRGDAPTKKGGSGKKTTGPHKRTGLQRLNHEDFDVDLDYTLQEKRGSRKIAKILQALGSPTGPRVLQVKAVVEGDRGKIG